MTTLKLALLGKPIIELDGKVLTRLRPEKSFAILFYLAATNKPCTRERLADLFWGDSSREPLNDLRTALVALRKQHLDSYLYITDQNVAFDRTQADVTLDVNEFKQLLQTAQPSPEQLQAAVHLYRGQFLEDLSLKKVSDDFEEWLRSERNYYQQKVLEMLESLVVYHTEQQQFSDGLHYVDRLLALEAWPEHYHGYKMKLLALTGRQTEAIMQYDLCAALQREKFGGEPSAETTELYRQIVSGDLNNQPPSRVGPGLALGRLEIDRLDALRAPTPAFQAPRQPPYFVGREQLLDVLSQHMRQKAPFNFVALVGMAGIGKTALAIYLAHQELGHFTDGVLWADMTKSDPFIILDSWGQAYGYDFSRLTDVESRSAALRNVLAKRKTLLILDDVIDVEKVKPLLPNSTGCAVLLTTKDWEVAVALDAQIEELTGLTTEDSLDYLRHVLGELRVEAEQAAAIALCTLLQNLPLAIEIVTKQLKYPAHQKIGRMVDSLRQADSRLALLKYKNHEVRASFSVSWQLLRVDLQQAFALLAAFEARPFTSEAYAYVAKAPIRLVESHLTELTSYSLLNERDEAHYQQHGLLAEFAQEQLRDPNQVFIRMAEFYSKFVAAHHREYSLLENEWVNISAGMQAALRFAQWPLVIQYADALGSFWFTCAHFADARQGYAIACAAAEKQADFARWARYLNQWARACIEQADYAEAKTLLARSQQLYRTLNDPYGESEIMYDLGRIATEQFEWDQAKQYLAHSRAIKEQFDDKIGFARSLWLEADIPYYRRDFLAARELGMRALEMQQAAKDKLGCIKSLVLLADIAIKLEQYALVHDHCDKALRICDEIQDIAERAVVYYTWSEAYRRQPKADLAIAKAHIDKSLNLFRHMGDRKMEAIALWRLSQIYLDQREYTIALETCRQNMALTKEIKNSWSLVYSLRHLGDIYQAIDDDKHAQRHWQESLALASEFTDHPEVAVLNARLGRS